MVLTGVTLLLALVLVFSPSIPQDLAYHQFADGRTIFGFPNFWNVLSNLPFVFIGLWAIWRLNASEGGLNKFTVLFLLGFFLTGFGSAYYHWVPSNQTLVWDRLPMTIAFMPFFALMLSLHIGKKVGDMLLWPLVATGIFSVIYWNYTEGLGQGDLRLYAAVQFIPIALVPLMVLLFPAKDYKVKYLWYLVAAYVSAKIFEQLDDEIYQFFPLGGHAIKHVAASLSGIAFVYFILSIKTNKEK